MDLPNSSNDATWFEAIIAGVSALVGGVSGGAIVIWRAATLAATMNTRVESAEGRLTQLAGDMSAHSDAQAEEIKALQEKLEHERAARHKMHLDNMELIGIVRREVVTSADKLREDLTNKIDRADSKQEERDARMAERFDRLSDRIMGRPQ